MKIVLLAVGKKHNADIAAAMHDYTARLQRFAPTEWVIVPTPKAATPPNEQKALESKKLLAQLKHGDVIVLLDERGQLWSSPEVAKQLAHYQQRAVPRLVFIIGGAYGVTSELAARATATWSLSPLVFPHMIARLLVAEQLYRASTILRGESYHHD